MFHYLVPCIQCECDIELDLTNELLEGDCFLCSECELCTAIVKLEYEEQRDEAR